MPLLSIGDIAKRTGVTVETLRFYEKQGLIPTPARSASGYRQYPQTTVKRVQLVQRAKAVGFTLSDIRELLALRTQPGVTCVDIRRRAESKIAEIEAKLDELERMRQALRRLAAQCSNDGTVSECPILDALEDNSESEFSAG